MTVQLGNIHPSEVLLEEFIKPLNLTQNSLARELDVAPRRINEVVLGRRSLTADMAIRLAYFFGTSEEFWMGLQDDYELEQAKQKIEINLRSIIQPFSNC